MEIGLAHPDSVTLGDFHFNHLGKCGGFVHWSREIVRRKRSLQKAHQLKRDFLRRIRLCIRLRTHKRGWFRRDF